LSLVFFKSHIVSFVNHYFLTDALDARIVIEPATLSGAARLAIRPYPRELEEVITLPSGRQLLARPIRPEDEPAHYELFRHFTPEDIRFRFFHMVREFP
jgi:acetyltransferase